MAIEVRTIAEHEAKNWLQSMGTAFLFEPAPDEAEVRRQGMHLERTWGAFEGDRVIGTLRSFPTPLTVPGPAELTAAALTNVTVTPTHRRHGLLTEMIRRDLTQSVERGEPLSILIASEYPIYGRFGYGAATESASYAIDTGRARFRDAGEGTVELVDRTTLRKEAPPVYEQFRTAQPGSIGRNDRWWDTRLHQIDVPGAEPPKGWQAVYRSPQGEAEGYVRYRAKGDWDGMRPNGLLTVEELVAVTPAAYHKLWRYCCSVDLTTRLEAGDRCVEETLGWLLTDARVVGQKQRFDFVWVRILDVVAAGSARSYATDGRVVIEVIDPLGWAAGRYLFDRSGCRRTTDAAHLTMPVTTLGSAYLGGFSLQTMGNAGLVDEHRPGALAIADAMFRSPITPWCSTWF